jgi:hypothetical protein
MLLGYEKGKHSFYLKHLSEPCPCGTGAPEKKEGECPCPLSFLGKMLFCTVHKVKDFHI